MNKLIWGSSQAITSLLFFMLQLSFLKSLDLQLMALFSTLFGVMNFCLLAIRRSLLEVNQLDKTMPGFVLYVAICFAFLLICIPIAFLIKIDVLILLCITLFLFDQLVLDTLRFSDPQNHKWYIAVQIVSVVLAVFLTLADVGASQIILILALLQFVFCVLCSSRGKRVSLNLKESIALFNFTRFIDFAINSGFGFFLPLLTFIFLNADAVGALRTSQNFLTLGSMFASALYYSALMGENVRKIPKVMFFIPSLILSGLVTILTFFVSPSVVGRMFGPYFYESVPLTLLLVVALVPTIWVFTMNAVLVNAKEFRFLFKTHSVSLIFLAFGSSIGFYFFGIIAYGFFAVFCAAVEAYYIKRFLKVRYASEIAGYQSMATPK